MAIDYRNDDFLARVRELTGPKGWTWCSTGSAARCRFAPSARLAPAEDLLCMPLSDARRAHELLDSSADQGKLVLVP